MPSTQGTNKVPQGSSSDHSEEDCCPLCLTYTAAGLIVWMPPLAVLVMFSQLSSLAPSVILYAQSVPTVVTGCCATLAILSWVGVRLMIRQTKHYCFHFLEGVTLILLAASCILLFPRFPTLSPAVITALSIPGLHTLCETAYGDVDSASGSDQEQTLFHSSHRRRWYEKVYIAYFSAALVCFVYWVVWICCGPLRMDDYDKWTDWDLQWGDMVAKKQIKWKVSMVSWIMPSFVSLELFVMGALAWYQSHHQLATEEGERLSVPDGSIEPHQLTHAELALVSKVKQLLMFLSLAAMSLWILAAIDSAGAGEYGSDERADLRGDVMVITFVVYACVFMWILCQLDQQKVKQVGQNSKVVKQAMEFLQSDVMKGLAVLCFAPFFPFIYCSKVWPSIKKWNLTTIIVNAHYWGFLYVFFDVGFAKATVVALAWLNEALAGKNVFLVSFFVFIMGFFLFLLPPTPGMPVYGITGIIVTKNATNAGWSFGLASAWAIFIGFAIKMAFAATAQKCIGESMANSDKIRYAVGVHTLEIKAMEQILKEPGLTAGKVSILIGGPDWPIAVFCGILRLPLWGILLGITPVLFQSVIPCVGSGALLYADDPKLKALYDSCLTLAGVLQGVAGLVAGYYMQQVIERDFDSLSVERPQDAGILKKAKEAEQETELFNKVTHWDELPVGIKSMLILGLLCVEVSLGLLVLPLKSVFGPRARCFKAFEFTGSVSKDLGGHPFSIVYPLGWVSIASCAVSILTLCIFNQWAKSQANEHEEDWKDDQKPLTADDITPGR